MGQVHDRTCPPVGDAKSEGACGPVWLDYSAFGAWWPRSGQSVVGVLDGTETVGGEELPRLRVVVRDVWTRDLRVSPDW